ncbi:MAG: murein biosynthesis integral membrane protein MurJ [Chloroflexi bacterium]|nr:MAG: murein biosynthesis integral membrane protein MurJ [Chloroflexota bacterium]
MFDSSRDGLETAVLQDPDSEVGVVMPVNLSENRGVVKAAMILAIGNVTSRVLGLAREIVKSNLFGTSGLLSAYTVAALVPMTLFNLITGGEMVSSSLVPVFSDYASKEKREELWGVVSTFLSVAIVLLVLMVGLVELFAPQVAWLVGARNFEDASLTQVSISLMRLATPALLFLSVASILTGVLYALERFTLPAFTAAVFNGTIVVVALLRPNRIESLAWGVLLGSLLQIVLQWPALRDGRLRWQFDWHHPAIRRIIILYAPIVAGLVVNQVAIWISYNLATRTGDSSVTFMTYATTLYQFPLGLVVTALSMATLPTLSQLATAFQTAESETAVSHVREFKATLAGGLRLVITLILPAAAGLFALAGPIIALLLEHGQFTPADTAMTARVLRVYLFGLPFAAVDQMLVFASYARKDTWRPALAGVISIVIYTITAVFLLRPIGLFSLMVADATKHFIHAMLMLWLLQRHLGGLAGHQIGQNTLKSVLAAALTGVAAWFVANWLASLPFTGFLFKLSVVGGGGLAGLVVYVLAVWLLDIPEAKSLPRLLRRR